MSNNFQLVLGMNLSWELAYSWLHCIGANLCLIKRLDILLEYGKSRRIRGQSKRIRLAFYKVSGTGTKHRLQEPAGFRDGNGGIRFWRMLKTMLRLETDIRAVTSKAGIDGMDAKDYVKVMRIIHNGVKQSMNDRRMYGYL